MKRFVSFAVAMLMLLSVAPLALAVPAKDAILNPVMNGEGTDLDFVNDATHPWQVVTFAGSQYAKSTIAGVDDGETSITAVATVEAGATISFDYKVSTEERYDRLIFGYTVAGSDERVEVFEASGVEVSSYTYVVRETNEYNFFWSYKKDVSVANNEDCVYVKNVVFGVAPYPSTFNVVQENVGLGVGETANLTVEYEPEVSYGEVTWQSSNTDVVSVSINGVVTALGIGEATITATCGNLSDTAQVYVVGISPVELYGVRVYSENHHDLGRFNLSVISQDIMEEEMLPLDLDLEQENAGLTAGEYYDGTFYAVYGNDLYSVDFISGESTRIGTTGPIRDMTYDYTNGRMLGIVSDSTGVQQIVEIDLETGAPTILSTVVSNLATIAYHPNGNIYSAAFTTGYILRVDPDSGETEVAMETGYEPRYLQSMTIDQNTGIAYWAASSSSDESIYMLDIEKNAMIDVNIMFGEVVGLHTIVGEVSDPVAVTGVTLDNTSINLGLGESVTLNAIVTPEDATVKRVTWTSSNTAVAKVTSKGVVTGTGSGVATITATTVDGGFTATCDVTVTGDYILYEDFEDALQGWTAIDADGDGHGWMSMAQFSQGQIAAYEGYDMMTSQSYINGDPMTGEGQAALEPDNWLISPEFTIEADATSSVLSWIAGSQDPSYEDHYTVYIGSGAAAPSTFTTVLYTGNAPGNPSEFTANLMQYAGQTVRIAFRHHDSGDRYMLNIDMIKVSMTTGSDTVLATGVELDCESGVTYVGGQFTLTANVLPETATNRNVVWTSSDETVATVENGVVTGVGAGEVVITVTTVDGGFSATCTIKVYEFMGDINGDGKFNTGDAVATLRQIAGLENATFIVELQDYNKDDKFNTGDAVAMLRAIAGLENPGFNDPTYPPAE